MKRLAAALAWAACAWSALAQVPAPAPSMPAACPQAEAITPRHLLGLWRAVFEGQAQGATLLLEPHPELAGGLRGEINRNGDRALLAGDTADGEFNLEESVNGTNISAIWLGDVVEGSCGREIRGSWKAEGDARQLPFVLRKESGP